MHSSTLQGVLQHLRKLTDPVRDRELGDGDLLERFRRCREEAAFTLLVQRHGAMVFNACRRILGDDHQAEDAFQATFLVLVRKASTIRTGASLSSWLYVVATHIAHKARQRSARQQCVGLAFQSDIHDDPSDSVAAGELRAALDEEIARLPDKYRTPLILCYLAEKTHEQAAIELGWPKSSVTARLAKARELLQRRLTRRGFAVPAGLLAALLTEATANAAVPSLLTLATVRLAVQVLNGEALTATSAAVLASGFVKGATALKVAGAVGMLAALGFAAAIGYRGAVPGFSPLVQKAAPKTQTANGSSAAKPERSKPRLDLFGDALPDEALARMGSSRMRHPFLRALFFSPDGKSLVTTTESDLRIWDVATGKLVRRFGLEKDGKQKSCRLVGDHFVRALLDDKWHVTVQVIDAATGRVHRRVRIKEPAHVANPTLSPDGKLIAIGHQKDLGLYDTATAKALALLPVKGAAPWSIAFAPDSKTVAFNDMSTDTIYLHDVANGKLIREMKRPGDTTIHLVFSPDGRFLAAMPQFGALTKGETSIWNVQEGKEVHRWTHPFRLAFSAAFSPDGKHVAISGARWGLVLWDVQTGKEIRRLSPYGGVHKVVFSTDGKILAAASPRGAIVFYEAATGKVLPASADADVQFFARLRFSTDGKRLFGDAGACLSWDAATGAERRRFVDPETIDFTFPTDLRCLVLSPDESLLAAANPDATISLWDAATGKKIRALKGHERHVWRLLFTPDGRHLISSGSDDVIRVWDVASGKAKHSLRSRTPQAISRDSRYLAAGDTRAPAVLVYDLTTGRETNRFAWPQRGLVSGVAFARDGLSLAAVGYIPGMEKRGVMRIWNLADRRIVRSFEDQKSLVWTVAFSPDGWTLATGEGEGGLTLWEVHSGRPRHRFVGHESPIHALAFAPDGRTLAASSVDAPVYVWDVAGTLESKPRRLSNEELRRSWAVLAGDDAAAAFQTILRLATVPEQTVPFLRERLKPVPRPDRKLVRQLVERLDSEDYSTRQKATEELQRYADAASGQLKEILVKEKLSLEVRRRLQQILDSLENNPELLRAVRAVEVLEWIATAEAVRLLGELANGAADARLTHEAIEAKRRLSR